MPNVEQLALLRPSKRTHNPAKQLKLGIAQRSSSSQAPALAPRAAQARLDGDRFVLVPEGAFSLREAALFGFGQRHEDRFDGCMRLCFCLDGYTSQVAVSLRQDRQGAIRGVLVSSHGRPAPLEKVAAQVARVLSLDLDARSFVALGEADPAFASLLSAAPGLRPPLFYSPYEAALWSVLSARRPRRTAEQWRTRLSRAIGPRFEIEGREMFSVPLPMNICDLGSNTLQVICGIEPQRAERVLAVAEAAAAGRLDAARLASCDLDKARAELKSLPGIGPFYADLILLRSTGASDILPAQEPRFLSALGTIYGLGRPASAPEAEALSRKWSPWRTWCALLVRAATPRIVPASISAAARSR